MTINAEYWPRYVGITISPDDSRIMIYNRFAYKKGEPIRIGFHVFDQEFSTETMTGGVLNAVIKNKEIWDIFIENTYQDRDYRIFKMNP